MKKSDHLELEVERKPQCIVEYRAKVDGVAAANARKKAVKSVAKGVTLPGFRKGKAPDHLIEKQYGKALEEQWRKEIADWAFAECEKLEPIKVLHGDSRIGFDMKSLTKEGAEMTFTFESEPELPEVKFDEIKLKNPKRKDVKEKEIKEMIDSMRGYFATWKEVKRAVKKGDHVTVDVDIIEAKTPDRALDNTRFKVDKANMAQWMYDLILGMKVGDEKEGVSTPDEDAPEDVKDTPAKKVKVTLRKVELQEMPEADDEFAKKVGAESFEQVKERVTKYLNQIADDEVRGKMREESSDKLLKAHPFEIPASLVRKEAEVRIKQLSEDPEFRKKIGSLDEEERKAEVDKIHQEAERAIRLFYICQAIVRENKIPIEPESHEMKSMLDAMLPSKHAHLYNAHNESQEQRALAMSRLMLEKAQDFVVDKVTGK